jgi:hypothetical protein
MKNLKYLFFVMFLAFSQMALAGTSTSRLLCPNLNANGAQILSSISELKSKLK